MPGTIVETLQSSTTSHPQLTMRRASPSPFLTNSNATLPQSWQSTSTPAHSTINNNTTSPLLGSTSPIVGKTSQVIDKLTAENERLRRELRAERAAKDELLQQQKVLKTLVSHLEEKNQTLKHQFDTHDSALARKERRLDDLKAQLETENVRRRKAEDNEAEMSRTLGETVAQTSRDVAEAKSSMKRSDAAYGTVSKEYMGMKGRIESLTSEFATYRRQAEEEARRREARFVQLEVLLDQKRQAMEMAMRVNKEQGDIFRRVREEVGEVAGRKKEMIETLDKMRWLMGLYKARYVEGDDDDLS